MPNRLSGISGSQRIANTHMARAVGTVHLREGFDFLGFRIQRRALVEQMIFRRLERAAGKPAPTSWLTPWLPEFEYRRLLLRSGKP